SASGFRTGYARDRPSRKSMHAQITDDEEEEHRAFSAPTKFPLRRDAQLSAWHRHLRHYRRPGERLHRLCLEREEEHYQRDRYRQIRRREDDQSRPEAARHRVNQG